MKSENMPFWKTLELQFDVGVVGGVISVLLQIGQGWSCTWNVEPIKATFQKKPT